MSGPFTTGARNKRAKKKRKLAEEKHKALDTYRKAGNEIDDMIVELKRVQLSET